MNRLIADAGVYSTNLTVQLTDYPISTFESIRKYANGTYTELNIATAVIAGDGLSFTHPDLVSGDLVLFTYSYANESIGRSMTLSYSISNSNPYYNVTNSVPLTTGYYTSTTARLAVPEGVRKTGLILTYETSAGVWCTERYIGADTESASWELSDNWYEVFAIDNVRTQSEITPPSGKLLDDELAKVEIYLNRLSTPQIKNIPLPRKTTDDEISILYIGSSWMKDNFYYVRNLAKEQGLKVTTANFYLSGASYSTLIDNFYSSAIDLTVNSYTGSTSTVTDCSIKSAIELRDWDVIVIANSAAASFDF